LARGATTAEERDQILAMAEMWEKLAFERLRSQMSTDEKFEADQKLVRETEANVTKKG
jgi:hypothetical protein